MANGMASIVTPSEVPLPPDREPRQYPENVRQWLRRLRRELLDNYSDLSLSDSASSYMGRDSYSSSFDYSYYSWWSYDDDWSDYGYFSSDYDSDGCSICSRGRCCCVCCPGPTGTIPVVVPRGTTVNLYNTCECQGICQDQECKHRRKSKKKSLFHLLRKYCHRYLGRKRSRCDKQRDDDKKAIPPCLSHDCPPPPDEAAAGPSSKTWKPKLSLEDMIYNLAKRRRHNRDAKKRVEDWVKVLGQLDGDENGKVSSETKRELERLRAAKLEEEVRDRDRDRDRKGKGILRRK